MRWTANQLITRPITALIRGSDLRNAWIHDRIARGPPPVCHGRELQFRLVAIGASGREVGEASQEIRRSSIHELDQVGEPLIEVARAETNEVRMKICHQSDLG